jgi:hypothetical protein
MINYLMTSVTYACSLLHEWIRRILYNEGGEENLGAFTWEIRGKGMETGIGS